MHETLAPALIPLAILLALDAMTLAVLRRALPRHGPKWARVVTQVLYFAVGPVALAAYAVISSSPGPVPLWPTMIVFATLAVAYVPKLLLLAVAAVSTLLLTPWLVVRAVRVAATGQQPEIFAWRIRPVAVVAACCGAVAFLGMLYAATLGRSRLVVRSQVVEVPGLPAGLDGLRVVHFSDLHVAGLPRGRYAERLAAAVNGLRPDLIVYTGDFGSPSEVATAPEIFGRMRASLGGVAVLGNHDLIGAGTADDDRPPSPYLKARRAQWHAEFLASRGFTLLENQAVLLRRGGARLGVLGLAVDDAHHGFADADLPAALAASDSADFRILVMHNPATWNRVLRDRLPVGAGFAGHTHAGQIAIEVGSLKWSVAGGRSRRWHGVYRVGEKVLHVSAGVGYTFLPFRLGVPPEVTLVELRRPAATVAAGAERRS